MSISQRLNNIREGVILADHTTFRIGGRAQYFFEANTEEDLSQTLKWARENNLPFFILGGGSNLLVADRGFEGLVIKIQNTKYEIQNTEIIAGAGTPLTRLAAESANRNLAGLEWAAGIPGTIGGAVCGNAGAWGRSISENVTGVRAVNSNDDIVRLNKEECGFHYRESAFKNNKGLVIVEVELNLESDKDGQAQETINKNLSERKNKIPLFPSAGSFFKNYVLIGEKDPLVERFPELKSEVKGGKISVGHLIELCGLKGKTIGGAQISEQHANFIVNVKEAKAADVLTLAQMCKEQVKEKFGIELEEEIIFLGF